MVKPWGPGNASELCKALGNWDGRQKDNSQTELKRRANSMGRYMQRVANHLGNIEIETKRGVTHYAILEPAPEPTPEPAVTIEPT